MIEPMRQNNWDGSSMPLPHMARMVTKDLHEVHRHMEEMFCPHDLSVEGGAPPIDFRHHQASLKSVTFNATDYGNPFGRVVVTIPPIETLYLVQFSLCGTAQIFHGKTEFDLRPGEMCVLNPGVPVRQAFGEGYKHFTVKLTKSSLESVLSRELGHASEDLIFAPGPVRLAGQSAAFCRLVQTICDDLDSGTSAFGHSRAAGAMEDALQRLLLAAVPHNYSQGYNSPNAAAAPYYVCRVEAFIRKNISEPITLDQMIEVSGVSARSLHAGFRRFRNTTPMNYLKDCRLSLARRKLIGGAENGRSVTEVALDCGFTHLSKFARDYRDRFDERPSETLRYSGLNKLN